MNKKLKILIVSIVVIAAAGTAGFVVFKKQTAVDTTVKNVFSVRKIDLDESINLMGTAVSNEVNGVFSDMEAPVAEIKVGIGDYVKAGDTICTFDVSELTKQRDEYVQKLKDYEKSSELKNNEYDDNIEYQKKVREKKLEYLQNRINDFQNRYNQEVQNQNDAQNKYNESVAKADDIKRDIDKVNDELSEFEALAESYSQQNAAAGAAGANADAAEALPTGIESKQPQTGEQNSQVQFDKQKYVKLQTDKSKLEILYQLALEKKSFYDQKVSESKTNAELLDSNLKNYVYQYEQLKAQGSGSSLTANEYTLAQSGSDLQGIYQEQIDNLNKKMEESVVVSQFDGVVTKVFASVGNYVVGIPICEIQNLKNMHFETYLSPTDVSLITKENEMKVISVTDNFEETDGKILEISDYYSVEDGGYKLSFTTADLDKMDIYPGVQVSAKIIIKQEKNAIVVPYDAIVENNGKKYVRKYDAQSGLQEDVEIETGMETSYYIAVASGNINENDVVMTELLQQ